MVEGKVWVLVGLAGEDCDLESYIEEDIEDGRSKITGSLWRRMMLK